MDSSKPADFERLLALSQKDEFEAERGGAAY